MGGARQGSGRKPKPVVLKLITGNPGRRPLNEDEPRPPAAIPDAPAHLTPVARQEWDRLAPGLYLVGILTELDRAVLSAYCPSWADVVEAEENIRRYGKLVKSPTRKITRRRRDGTESTETSGGYPMQSPYVAIRNRALALMGKFAVELGRTPSSRGRVSAVRPDKPPDPAAKYFR